MRNELELADEIGHARVAWESSQPQDDTYLIAGDRLARALRSSVVASRSDLVEFLHASRHASRRRRRWRRIGWAAVAAVVVTALLGLGLFVVDRRAQASAKARARASTFPVGEGSSQFEIDVHEVSVGQYLECVQHGPCTEVVAPSELGFEVPDSAAPTRALVFVQPRQAHQFCRWLGRDLPTAEQWDEFASVATNIWTVLRTEEASGDGAPRSVDDAEPNYGNVVELTRSPAETADDELPGELPNMVIARGLSGQVAAQLPAQIREWRVQDYSYNTSEQAGDDVGFRCVASQE